MFCNFLLFGIFLMSSVSGLEWLTSHGLQNDVTVQACTGSSVSLPWQYQTEGSEHVVSIQWLFHSKDGVNHLIATKSGDVFHVEPTAPQSAQNITSAGIRLLNVSRADIGVYTVNVTSDYGNGTLVRKSQHIQLDVADPAVQRGSHLYLTMSPTAVYQDGHWEVQIKCGPFSSRGQPPVEVIWTTPGQKTMQSTTFSSNGYFLLDLPAAATGNYSCRLAPSITSRCLPTDSPFLTSPVLSLELRDIESAILYGRLDNLTVENEQLRLRLSHSPSSNATGDTTCLSELSHERLQSSQLFSDLMMERNNTEKSRWGCQQNQSLLQDRLRGMETEKHNWLQDKNQLLLQKQHLVHQVNQLQNENNASESENRTTSLLEQQLNETEVRLQNLESRHKLLMLENHLQRQSLEKQLNASELEKKTLLINYLPLDSENRQLKRHLALLVNQTETEERNLTHVFQELLQTQKENEMLAQTNQQLIRVNEHNQNQTGQEKLDFDRKMEELKAMLQNQTEEMNHEREYCNAKLRDIYNLVHQSTTTAAPQVSVAPTALSGPPKDCQDVHRYYSQSGIYTLTLSEGSFQAYCDFDSHNGGWTVIQKRLDGSVNFYRDWNSYEHGFGHLTGEYWIGLANLHHMTSHRCYQLRVQLTDINGNTGYATYDNFSVQGPDTRYALRIGGFSGNIGDSMTSNVRGHNLDGIPFTTYNYDNDRHARGNCAQMWGGGWWYNDCSFSNLNGLHPMNHPYSAGGTNIMWYTWHHNQFTPCITSVMMIKPHQCPVAVHPNRH